MSGLQYLPFDIIYALYTWLDKPTLIALNMVNFHLYQMTVNLVWAQVTLPRKGESWAPRAGESWADLEGIVTMLLHSPRPNLQFIKCLRINIMESFIPSGSEADTLRRVSSLIDLLKSTKGLRNLAICLSHTHQFGKLFYRELARNPFPFRLLECTGPYAPEFLHFLKAMTSLKSLTMAGDSWFRFSPDSNDWPLLQSVAHSNIESIAPLIPGRPIQEITVFSLGPLSPGLKTFISGPVESVRRLNMQVWESEYSVEGARAFVEALSDLGDVFPKISTLRIGDWFSVVYQPLIIGTPPLFTDTAFLALGRFKNLRTLICPIWVMEGRMVPGVHTNDGATLLSQLGTHCPTLREVFLSASGLRNYEHWSRRDGTGSSAMNGL